MAGETFRTDAERLFMDHFRMALHFRCRFTDLLIEAGDRTL